MLTEREKQVVREVRCFDLSGHGYGNTTDGLAPHSLLAKERGAEFEEYAYGNLVPSSLEGYIKTADAIIEIAEWLGLQIEEYLHLLHVEKELIFQRAREL